MGDSDFRKMIAAKVAAEKGEDQQKVEERLDDLSRQPSIELPELDTDMLMAIPDVAGTVPGWRTWGIDEGVKPSVDSAAKGPLLRSATKKRYVWAPREIQEAFCPYGRHPGIAPEESCTCGYYSAKDYDHLLSMSYHQYDAENWGGYTAVGEVANWGKVIEGSQGWRAQFCYPRVLYVPFEAWHLARPLQEAYGVPVKLMNFLGLQLEPISPDAPLK